MDTLITLASLALAFLVLVGLGAVFGTPARRDERSSGLEALFVPIVAAFMTQSVPPRPVVREEEPVRWNFARLDQTRSGEPIPWRFHPIDPATDAAA
ncbi:MAG TPA: hypothetical protein VFY18_06900 [Candidatus Limnocylindrales bacterium]|nr:hypothetical protein [Candidatus Limnocylindrales bacterium]